LIAPRIAPTAKMPNRRVWLLKTNQTIFIVINAAAPNDTPNVLAITCALLTAIDIRVDGKAINSPKFSF